jgi:hypothetical protein
MEFDDEVGVSAVSSFICWYYGWVVQAVIIIWGYRKITRKILQRPRNAQSTLPRKLATNPSKSKSKARVVPKTKLTHIHMQIRQTILQTKWSKFFN